MYYRKKKKKKKFKTVFKIKLVSDEFTQTIVTGTCKPILFDLHQLLQNLNSALIEELKSPKFDLNRKYLSSVAQINCFLCKF